MDYLSIDIETTGLDYTRHQMIEFGAVWDRAGCDRVMFRRIVLHEDYVMSPYCVTLHTGLFEEINALQPDSKVACSLEELPTLFREWLLSHGWGGEKLNITGKNYLSFDVDWVDSMLLAANVGVRRRVLDPAILYVKDGDDRLPNLDTCLSRAGIEVNGERHTAVYDALCVCLLLREAGL